MSARPSLRDLLTQPLVAQAVGARDGLTAKQVAAAGFQALWLSSFELSAIRALPDVGLLTLTECLEAVLNVVSATDLPLLVDGDTGFGGARNLARTVELLERAGASGLCIEDKQFPKRNSFLERGQHLEVAEEFSARLEVACRVRQSHDFVIVARCEAFIAGVGLREALRRCHLYVDSGADAILIHSRSRTPAEIELFLGAWQGRAPVVVVPTTFDGWSVNEAAAAGVSMVIYANQTLRAAVHATERVLRRIYEGGSADSAGEDLATMGSIFELTDLARWDRLEPRNG